MRSVRQSFAVLLAAVIGVGVASGPGQAAGYPDKPIMAVVPFGSGGQDTVARLVAAKLGEKLGQQIVVVNKPGAGGNIGMQVVAEADPDGYTILFNGPAATYNAAMFSTLPFDPVKDLVAVAKVGSSPNVVVARSSLRVNTLEDLINLAKKEPGKLNAGVGGAVQRLNMELFKQKAGIDVQIIPYTSAGPLLASLLGGEIDFGIITPSSFAGQLDLVKPLAVAADKRISEFPDWPTTTEAGLPGYIAEGFTAVFVPGGTPAEIVSKLNLAVNEIIQEPESAKALVQLGLEPTPVSAEAFSAQVLNDIQVWKDIVKSANIPPVE